MLIGVFGLIWDLRYDGITKVFTEEHQPLVELLALLIVVIILGALAGADSFGETIRTGCGCLFVLILLGFVGLFLFLL